MTPRQLKSTARKRAVTARVISDGCRDYLIEIITDSGAGLLRRWDNSVVKLRNLGDVHQLLERCGVDRVVLRQRVAQDEACYAEPGGNIHDQPLKIAS